MGDWEFLYEMNARGYSAQAIADAAACGYAPWDDVDIEWIDSTVEDGVQSNTERPQDFRTIRISQEFPQDPRVQIEIFNNLLDSAERHFDNTGRYLQIWGELGELYAEIKYKLRRHERHTPGSDGTIGGRLVEVKTISPEKLNSRVQVKKQGNFEQLLIVRINSDFEFEAKLFERSELNEPLGKFIRHELPANLEAP